MAGPILLLWMAASAPAADWYVATNGVDSSAGTNWDTAFLTVSNAVALAQDGDSISVSNGTYAVVASSPIVITNAVVLLGVNGSSNTFLRGPYPASGRVLVVSNANAAVDGFTITNGNVTLWDPNWGGGVYLAAGALRNCLVAGNYTTDGNNAYGGGVFMSAGSISNCVIAGNYARAGHLRTTVGGGVYMAGGVIRESRIERNQAVGSATGWGGSSYGGGWFWPAAGS